MAGTTLAQITQYVADGFGGYRSAITTGTGTTTTLIDNVNLVAGGSKGLTGKTILVGGVPRMVEKVDGATGTLTFCPALAQVVGQGVAYEVYSAEVKEIQSAINKAIRALGNGYLVARHVENLSLNVMTGEMDLPEDCVVVDAVYGSLPQTNTQALSWAPLHSYEILNERGQRRLVMKQAPSAQDGVVNVNVRLQYLALAKEMQAAGDTTGAGDGADAASDERGLVAFLEEYALHLLHEKATAENPSGDMARTHNTLRQAHFEKAMNLKMGLSTPRVARHVQRAAYGRQVSL